MPVNANIGSTIHLAAVTGAVKYQVELLDSTATQVAPQDPATNDPDGDGWVEVTPNPDGTGDLPISVFLTGKPLGNYTVRATSEDSNGQRSTTPSTLGVTYVTLPPPDITIT